MAERNSNRWQDDPDMLIPLEPEELLEIRRAVAEEDAVRQQEIRAAIQDILESEGPMLGTTLYTKLKKRIPDITTNEYRRARQALGYPLDPLQIFTLIRN